MLPQGGPSQETYFFPVQDPSTLQETQWNSVFGPIFTPSFLWKESKESKVWVHGSPAHPYDHPRQNPRVTSKRVYKDGSIPGRTPGDPARSSWSRTDKTLSVNTGQPGRTSYEITVQVEPLDLGPRRHSLRWRTTGKPEFLYRGGRGSDTYWGLLPWSGTYVVVFHVPEEGRVESRGDGETSLPQRRRHGVGVRVLDCYFEQMDPVPNVSIYYIK